MRSMLQVVIDKDLLFDFKNYCDENNVKYTEAVRKLIHEEVYSRQSLARPQNYNPTKATNRHKKAFQLVSAMVVPFTHKTR